MRELRLALSHLADLGIPVQTVLDVGASNGIWSAACQHHFPDASYVLYEAQPCHHNQLSKFANQSNRTAVYKAVGGSVGETWFLANDPQGGALSDKNGPDCIRVPITTIDQSVKDLGLQGPFLLKTDTHGHEKEILDGASSTLPNCSALCIEAYNFKIADDCLCFWELCEHLTTKGFRPIRMFEFLYREFDGVLWQMDIIFIRSSWPGFQEDGWKQKNWI